MVYICTMNTFGRALKDGREKRQLSMREVAERASLSPQTILRAERGDFVRFEIAMTLTDALKMKPPEQKKLMSKWVDDEVARYRKLKKS